MTETPILPAHIESTIQAIAQLHTEHYKKAAPLQRIVDRMTSAIGRPGFIAGLTLAVLVWCGGNLLAVWAGHTPWDEPPFFWMQGVVGLGALYVTEGHDPDFDVEPACRPTGRLPGAAHA